VHLGKAEMLVLHQSRLAGLYLRSSSSSAMPGGSHTSRNRLPTSVQYVGVQIGDSAPDEIAGAEAASLRSSFNSRWRTVRAAARLGMPAWVQAAWAASVKLAVASAEASFVGDGDVDAHARETPAPRPRLLIYRLWL